MRDSVPSVDDAAIPGPLGRRHLAELDGVRAIAALLVIVEHFYPPGRNFYPGAIGVDVFFTLSGFLITLILLGCGDDIAAGRLTRGRALRQFYIRRFLRIFPLYYLYLAFVIGTRLLPARVGLAWCATFMSNVYFVKYGFFYYVGHLWTLAVEEQFYILWPLIVLTVPRRWMTHACVIVIVAGTLFKNSILPITGNEKAPLLLLPSCVDTLAFGALLAVSSYTPAGLEKVRRWVRYALWPGVAIIVAGIALHTFPMFTPSILFSLSIGICLVAAWLIIHATGPNTGRVSRFLTWRPLRYIGTISYGIYVWHIATVLPVKVVVKYLHLPVLPDCAVCLLVMGLSIGVASASWWLYERPINELKRFFPYKKPATA